MPLFWSRGFVVTALTYAVVSLISTQIPLLNYLGYEFAALIGLVGSVVSGLLTIHLVKPVYRANDSAGEELTVRILGEYRQAVLLNLVALVIPLVILLTNALFVKNCSLVQGLTFFILIPVVSVLFGSAIGLLSAVHYRFSNTMFGFYCLLFLSYSAATGYFTPAIFSYNFLYGYFPGLTYDEALGLSITLALFRLMTVLVGLAFVWMSVLLVKHCSPTETFWVKGVSLLKRLADSRHRVIAGAFVVAWAVVWIFR